MKVAVIVHVFYPEMWSELADCVRNLGVCDLTVTYVDEAAVGAARRDFPAARFIRCKNRGYDVWPFVTALKALDLARYDLVVKLHTKRNIERAHVFAMGGTRLNGSAWRDRLLGFVKTPEAWAKTQAAFDDPQVGMVAGRRVVFGRKESGKGCYDAALRELNEKFSIPARRGGLFVGGTMFAVRAALLRPFADFPFTAEMFAASGGHESTTYAHLMERMLGLAVGGQGFCIEGFDGSVRWHRFWVAIKRFFFENRWSERRHSIRICGITVYLRRLK